MRAVVLDAGNTAVKAGFFDEAGRLVEVQRTSVAADLAPIIAAFGAKSALVASVDAPAAEVAAAAGLASETTVLLSPEIPLPIKLRYATPRTLGADRLAAAVGAAHLFPGEAVLIVDAGTCLKCDWLTADNTFVGGSISPGLQMRFRALTEFTGRLPLVLPAAAETEAAWPGDSTIASIRAGVELGFVSEARAFIARATAQAPQMRTVLTGGDAPWLAARLGVGGDRTFVVEPQVVLLGLYRLLLGSFATSAA